MKKHWSFWEDAFYRQEIDLIVVGGGFAGVSLAYHAKLKHPRWKILLLEKDAVGGGASTKNAGFACYGTAGEILDDWSSMGEDASLNLVEERIEGLKFLQELIPAKDMHWKNLGGNELFVQGEQEVWEQCQGRLEHLNAHFRFKANQENLFQVINETVSPNQIGLIHSPLEAQLNPVLALLTLRQRAMAQGVKFLHGIKVDQLESHKGWLIHTTSGTFKSKQVVFATNAFGVPDQALDINPARNQVLISKPFKHQLKPGNYHAQAGYVYFRTIGDRILIGGARNLDLEGESTSEFGPNEEILNYLRAFMDNQLGWKGRWEEEQNWSGIIATGSSKQAIIKELRPGLWYLGRFGGMGLALGAISGKKAANLLNAN